MDSIEYYVGNSDAAVLNVVVRVALLCPVRMLDVLLIPSLMSLSLPSCDDA
jgi:hypothetical protein